MYEFTIKFIMDIVKISIRMTGVYINMIIKFFRKYKKISACVKFLFVSY